MQQAQKELKHLKNIDFACEDDAISFVENGSMRILIVYWKIYRYLQCPKKKMSKEEDQEKMKKSSRAMSSMPKYPGMKNSYNMKQNTSEDS
jgi:hypothetical protein